MEYQGPVGYRPPLSSVLPVVGVLVLLAFVVPHESGVIIALGIATTFAIIRLYLHGRSLTKLMACQRTPISSMITVP